MKRRTSKQIKVGNVLIGGNAPISIQTMLNNRFDDVDGSIKEIERLKNAGADLVRIAIQSDKTAEYFAEIASKTDMPLIADCHYSYRLATTAVKSGAKKVRINPGNTAENKAEFEEFISVLKDFGVPVRIGVNGGSLGEKYKGEELYKAIADSALDALNDFVKYGFNDVVLAAKSSNPLDFIASNRIISASCDYPMHLGVTESGTLKSGLIKSTIGISTLLQEGIGDTIRVSLSDEPIEEVRAGKTLLKALGLKNEGVDVVSCPTCARTEIDVKGFAERIEKLTENVKTPLKISVMGCRLNGIGEGKDSDIGVCGGKEVCTLMLDGEIYKTVKSSEVDDELMKLINSKIK